MVVAGSRAPHVVAFRREGRGQALICVAAIRTAGALDADCVPPPDWWGDTTIDVAGSWRDLLGGAGALSGGLRASALFRVLPVALLASASH